MQKLGFGHDTLESAFAVELGLRLTSVRNVTWDAARGEVDAVASVEVTKTPVSDARTPRSSRCVGRVRCVGGDASAWSASLRSNERQWSCGSQPRTACSSWRSTSQASITTPSTVPQRTPNFVRNPLCSTDFCEVAMATRRVNVSTSTRDWNPHCNDDDNRPEDEAAAPRCNRPSRTRRAAPRPRAGQAPIDEAALVTSTRGRSEQLRWSAPMTRVLIVEDDGEMAGMLRTHLANEGYDVDVASTTRRRDRGRHGGRAGPRAPRHRARARGRPRGVPRAPAHERRPDDLSDRPRPRDRSDRGAQDGRRRLHGQAVLARRGLRAHRVRPAQDDAARAGHDPDEPTMSFGAAADQRGDPRGAPRRRAHRAAPRRSSRCSRSWPPRRAASTRASSCSRTCGCRRPSGRAARR